MEAKQSEKTTGIRTLLKAVAVATLNLAAHTTLRSAEPRQPREYGNRKRIASPKESDVGPRRLEKLPF